MINKIKGMFKTITPKREVLEKEILGLQSKKLAKVIQASFLKKDAPENSWRYDNAMKELALLNLKLADVVDEYNRFVAREEACQKAFDRLNGLDK